MCAAKRFVIAGAYFLLGAIRLHAWYDSFGTHRLLDLILAFGFFILSGRECYNCLKDRKR